MLARGLDTPSLRNDVRTPTDEIDGQVRRDAHGSPNGKLRPLQGQSGIRTFAFQCGDLAAQEGNRSAIRGQLLTGHGEGRFGLGQLEARIDLRGDTCTRQCKDLPSLLKRILEQVTQRVRAVQPQIGLNDGNAQHQARRLQIDLGGMHTVQSGINGRAVLPPEIQFVVDAQGCVIDRLPGTGNRWRDRAVLTEAFAFAGDVRIQVRKEWAPSMPATASAARTRASASRRRG